MVAGVGDGSRAVHDDRATECGFVRCFACFEESGLRVVECGGGETPSGLDVVRVEVSVRTHVVGGGVELLLVSDNFGWVVGPLLIRDALSGGAELPERLVKDTVRVLGNAEFELDGPNDVTPYVCLLLSKG